jgi:hypothetical protein
MTHVDALSRHIMLIDAPTLEDELMKRQMTDEQIRDLALSLEYKENKRWIMRWFIGYIKIVYYL